MTTNCLFRMFAYDYDGVNRLNAATYTGGKAGENYTTGNLSYDANGNATGGIVYDRNGNIKKMNQWGLQAPLPTARWMG